MFVFLIMAYYVEIICILLFFHNSISFLNIVYFQDREQSKIWLDKDDNNDDDDDDDEGEEGENKI